MQKQFVIGVVVALVSIMSFVTTLIAADTATMEIVPNVIKKGESASITIKTDITTAKQGDLHIRVGGYTVKVDKDQGGDFIAKLPGIDLMGKADITLVDNQDSVIAKSELRYVAATKKPIWTLDRNWIIALYMIVVIIPPTFLTWYDINRTYKVRADERDKVLSNLKNYTPKEAVDILKTISEGASGLSGLTRGIVAVTLLVVLGMTVFHLLIFMPSGDTRFVEQLINLLAGGLTSIIGFYYGTRAAEKTNTSTQSKQEEKPLNDKVKPKITEITPDNPSVGDEIEIQGKGFGNLQGSGEVLIDNKEYQDAIEKTNWNDNFVKIKIPQGFSGKTKIVIKNNEAIESNVKEINIT